MLVDRYPPADLFALVPEPAAACGPELRELDRPLDDDAVFQRPRADPARRAPHGLSRGRPGTPVEVVLRLLVVKRLYGWS
jgi:IS5 family transposase